MQKPGVVVVVTEETAVLSTLTLALEAEGWVVLPLEDGAELYDYVEFIIEHPKREGGPRLIIADASVPGPSVLEVAAWAMLKGLSVPFLFFRKGEDARAAVHDALAA